MKKSFLLMMALICTVVAGQAITFKFDNSKTNWDQVACWPFNDSGDDGKAFTGQNWPGAVMTKGADGIYTWEYTGDKVPTKVIFNNNNHGSQTATFKYEAGATYDNDGIVGAVVVPDTYPAMYVVGTITGWSKDDSWKLNTTDGTTYTLENVSIPGDAEFKFFGGSWGTRELTAGKVTPNESIAVAAGYDNMTISEAVTNATIKLVCAADYKTGTLTIITEGGNGDDPNPPTPDFTKLYLRGTMNDWGTDIQLATEDGVVYTWTGSIAEGKEFKIASANWELPVWGYGDNSDNKYTVASNETLTLNNSKASANLIAGGEIVSLTLNTKTGELVVGEGGEAPELDAVVITGDYNLCYSGSYNKIHYWEDGTGNTTTWPGVEMTEYEYQGNLYYVAKVAEGTTHVIFNGEGGQTGNLEYTSEYVMNNSGATKQKVLFETNDPSGVEAVEVAAEAPVYFNLQGVKVANPENGLYIKVQGGKSTKVLVK